MILGILAATALPKFVDLSKDARIAAVESMKGALVTAAELAHSKCAVTSGCLAGNTQVTIGGVTGLMYFGYPIESNRGGVLGIQQVVNYSGFTYSDGGVVAYFDKDGAPTPSSCRVTYEYSGMTDVPPIITPTTSGC